MEHRRTGDRELLGWIRPEGDEVVAVDRLGRDLTAPTGWSEAEEALDARGLGWLAGVWELRRDDGRVERVRLTEVGTDRVVVSTDDHGAVDVPTRRTVLPLPAPPSLRPFTGDAQVVDALGRHAHD
ncbi:hypothetical protein SAMN05421867_104167 [Cellulomonas marina]|uniref:Uncharacterized protein n=1 Tax=Cellulomonas marina TaxID=988821 RepID=A0A1I0X9I5_9CELL|nr:hypothetical protein SAMN05421867_104167 [Cellulomonas marina]